MQRDVVALVDDDADSNASVIRSVICLSHYCSLDKIAIASNSNSVQ